MMRRHLLVITLLVLGFAARILWMLNAPFPDHFWMDERFSAAVITQPVGEMLDLCRRDVHPPLYYLALKSWNALWIRFAPARRVEPEPEIIAYRLPGIGREGIFSIDDADGVRREVPGLYPHDWPDWPLAPLSHLRLLSIGMALLAAVGLFALVRRLYPSNRLPAYIALVLMLFSPFMLTWDTVIRSYAMMAALIAWAAMLAACPLRKVWLWVAGLAAASALMLLTGYVTILIFPALVLVPFILHRRWPLAGQATLGVMLGVVVFALVWGGVFLGQSALRVPLPESGSLVSRLGAEATKMAAVQWQMLFSFGVTAHLNPFSSLAGYAIAFLLYAACLGMFAFELVSRPTREDVVVLIAALSPSALAALLNASRPETIPIYARYFYPFAPFYFLLLARGATILISKLRSRRRA